ncbi:SusD/RagB family nutrient-binding outer membrane lipoprotein [Ginsengibacter hankyongi]|uniref:SusD/RagB family nutrient-binding outer membrane lipoprotein n=1 Tax=Ginsengibacter hankyongi TaxID=2607284 RepID=A0A5J5IDH9_9BACT|nr:SusD/RagB family nutrient-binding outer membrane lipoprotein [Ginsengibacter hankyongi]KAA9037196.1 SusD/RagB family nutrient-binding outer membrane lipoprotein [Ginsengibacter hankyongi]
MKRFIFYISLIAASVFSSCKKDLKDRFYNPDQLSEGVTDIVPGLFTSSISTNKIFVQDYGEWYYLLNGGTSITGFEQIAERYISYRYDWFATYDDLTTGNGFDDFPITSQGYFQSSYTRLKTWETIRNEVNNRSGQDKLDANVYFKLVTLVKDYQSAKLVDLFNSIPYFYAFQGSNGDNKNWYPPYDDPKEIYKSIITDLGDLTDSLTIAYNLMSPTAKQILAQQDLVFKGDISKWTQFANATRLKLLVRIAGVDAGYAKPLIQETLTKPLPQTDLSFQMWFDTDQKSAGGFWMRGLYENTYASFIPNIIMKRLNYGTSAYEPGTDDPRLPVLAMPTKYNDYRGVTYNVDTQTPIYNSGDKYYPYADNLPASLSTNAKSMYNFATFTRNGKMPVYMFSRTELDLLLAEIEMKGLATTGEAAEDHIKDAVIHSINYWYNINGNSDFKDDPDAQGAAAPLYPAKPSDVAIANWGDTIKAKFMAAASVDDKMEILMQQKFIHLNLMQPYELWTELRRTGHPKLEPFTWHGALSKPFPERVRYPSEEQTNNPTNLSKVSADNNLTSKIFWVPADRNPNLYWDDYNYK